MANTNLNEHTDVGLLCPSWTGGSFSIQDGHLKLKGVEPVTDRLVMQISDSQLVLLQNTDLTLDIKLT